MNREKILTGVEQYIVIVDVCFVVFLSIQESAHSVKYDCYEILEIPQR